ncbi:hypothetical protein [Bradyrhizobium lablabi]|uniref:Uncharacterized protein n=1 Tax=Bradyrhizobium lablabi TaxID=722472 RepID=A0A1H5JLK5_9BRAD|nr:hypothetical protein [Bradyrhizobium lablabi]SEE53366.1 hypothetical protein SAMN05444171_7892 [Bradyrhizobium lablabi]
MGSLPPASGCSGQYLGFDSTGQNFACLPGVVGGGTVVGPGSSAIGNLVLWNSLNGTFTKDGGPITAFGLSWVGLANVAAAWGTLGIVPCAQSEGLTGDVTKAAGSCVTAISYTSSLTGGVSRPFRSKLGDAIEAADFGVVCDGVTDTRVALQQAINSTPMGGTLRISKQNTTGACMVSKGAGAYALLITQPIRFVCDGGVAIQPTSALGTSSSVLYVNGNPNGVVYQTIIEGCFIGNPGSASRFGLHGIVFDTTTAGNYLRGTVVKNVFIQAGTSGSGYGIYCNNNGTNNPNGGIYAATLGETSFIQGGIFLGSSGDSITIGTARDCPADRHNRNRQQWHLCLACHRRRKPDIRQPELFPGWRHRHRRGLQCRFR